MAVVNLNEAVRASSVVPGCRAPRLRMLPDTAEQRAHRALRLRVYTLTSPLRPEPTRECAAARAGGQGHGVAVQVTHRGRRTLTGGQHTPHSIHARSGWWARHSWSALSDVAERRTPSRARGKAAGTDQAGGAAEVTQLTALTVGLLPVRVVVRLSAGCVVARCGHQRPWSAAELRFERPSRTIYMCGCLVCHRIGRGVSVRVGMNPGTMRCSGNGSPISRNIVRSPANGRRPCSHRSLSRM